MSITGKIAILLLACMLSFSCRSNQSPDPHAIERIRSLEAENAELRKRAEQQQAVPQATGIAGSPKIATGKPNDHTARELAFTRLEVEQFRQQLQALRAELAETRQRSQDVESRANELQSQLSTAAAENARLSAAASEVRQALAEANNQLGTLRADLQAQKDSVTQLEATNARLRKAAATQDQTALLAEMQDVAIRREQHVDNLLRRYRELTEYYRTLAGAFDGRRNGDSVAPNGAEFSRIQNTLASAEEDMRQLTALNARMQLIRRRLSARDAAGPARR